MSHYSDELESNIAEVLKSITTTTKQKDLEQEITELTKEFDTLQTRYCKIISKISKMERNYGKKIKERLVDEDYTHPFLIDLKEKLYLDVITYLKNVKKTK